MNTPDPKTVLLGLLAALATLYAVAWGWREARDPSRRRPTVAGVLIGALTNFFDTLGVGSFAPTAAMFRAFDLVDDRVVPGTMNVGHALPSIAQALIFIAIVAVDPLTLVAMIGGAVLGAWVGAGWSRSRVQRGMGVALLAASVLLVRQLVYGSPVGADAIALEGPRFVLGVLGNVVLGAIMTLGVGLYGPCMILVSLLGMNPKAAFPIMMGSCAFLMPVAGWRFIVRGAYDARAALGLTLGGIPAVLVAAFIVESLPLDAVRGLVLVVATYTAVQMLRAAAR